jgi:penicillin-binding protein 1A
MTQRARRRSRRTRPRIVSKVLLGIVVVASAMAIGALSFGVWVLEVMAKAPSIDELKPEDKGENSIVFAADGSRLGYIQSDVIRTPVSLDEISQEMIDATIAIEDERFYDHNGVDPEAILRAFWENLQAGEALQGGSTISQQLVRNLYIDEPEDTLERKLREAQMALDLEEKYTKQWILEKYLNTASYGTVEGRTAVGVEGAAQIFFSKPSSELSLDEAALLAGLPQAPSQYNPLTSPDQAVQRRNQVLDQMAEQGLVPAAEAARAKQDGLGLNPSDRYSEIREPFFFDYVEHELIERYGVQTVRQGGLRVYTTIDPALQAEAQNAVANQVASLGGPSGALVSIDHSTGQIAAMASSGDYATQQYNLATQGHRQPGSAFKPFVLATALEQGIDPDSTYYSGASPITLDVDGAPWLVNNAEGGGGGTMSITAGTTNSVNVVYAQLGLDVGPENVADVAHELGIESPLDGYAAESIGGLRIGVSPLEMANAYGTFASGGIHRPATGITRVEFRGGEVDELGTPEGERVISDGIAYEITRILETVVTSGTGTAAGYGCPAAGKTGTTDDYTDAWFVGYTPRLSTAVWVGYPDARTSMGTGAYGGTYAAPIWNDFMSTAAGGYCGDFAQPTSTPTLSAFYGDHAVTDSSKYAPTGGTESTYEPTDTTTGDGGTSSAPAEEYDPNLYAPGAGQEPAPAAEPEEAAQPEGGSEGGGPAGGGPADGGVAD